MKSQWRLSALVMLCILLIFPVGMVNGAQTADVGTLGKLKPPSSSYTPGTWFLGATPPNADPSKPPIVFVQGMNGKAQDWFESTVYHGTNDMYETAYNNGYRTVFVQLYDAAGNGAANQWNNGQLLAGMLEEIHGHFGQKVNIVAHSKGGPDTQAALIHYGAYRFVNKVVTLGSPHHGSHLADLAHSWYAGWLAELLGQQSDGTYSLQTGNMAQFRQQTDNHVNANKNTYYTVAGTDWGPTFSALWSGGLYLSQYGSNDGLVNVWSTKLPYGQHLFTASLDHDNIRMGSTVFGRIEPVLRTPATTTAAQTASLQTTALTTPAPAPDEQYVYGAPLTAKNRAEHMVAVDSKTKEAIFTILTKSPDVKVTLISPSGKTYHKQSREYISSTDQQFFAGASVQAFRIAKPEKGNWKVNMVSPNDDAYLLLGKFSGSKTLSLNLPGKSKAKNLPLELKLNQPEQFNLSSMNVNMKVIGPDGKNIKQNHAAGYQANMLKDANKAGIFIGQLPAGTKPGVYNITIELKGKTKQGEPFTRTIVRSVYIDN